MAVSLETCRTNLKEINTQQQHALRIIFNKSKRYIMVGSRTAVLSPLPSIFSALLEDST